MYIHFKLLVTLYRLICIHISYEIDTSLFNQEQPCGNGTLQ